MAKSNLRLYLLLCVFIVLGASVSLAEDLDADQLRNRRASINDLMDLLEDPRSVEAEPIVVVPQLPQTKVIEPQAVKAHPSAFQQNVKISGQVRTAMGINDDGHMLFNRANADLNEKNFRVLSSDQLNGRQNTYDPAIYSRIKVVVDAAVASSVSMHMNVTLDPWSYTGKSKEQLVTGAWGDTANVRYLTWGNTNYSINRPVSTLKIGDAFNLPEIKVKNGIVPATTVTSSFGDTFNIPAAKVEHTFMPLREAWLDLKPTDRVFIRVFPMAYDNQALTTDDPLKLSNNKTWWEESPWLRDWTQGIYNSGGPDFTKGKWDRSLAFFTRDSDNQHLTALRGVAMTLKPTDDTLIKATIASPKTLWQDYGDVTAVPASVRIKQYVGDRLYLGSVINAHQGYVNNKRDAENYTGGFDTGFIPIDGFKISGEYSTSRSRYDETNPAYASKQEGDAYYASLETSSNSDGMLNKDYFAMSPADKKENFYKSKVFWARMDQDFESSLSNYNETQRDAFWSRDLTFYPSTYRYMPGATPGQTEDDLIPFAIGDGLAYGRSVTGWRGDTRLLEDSIKGMGDVRRVTDIQGNHLNTVARTEWSFKPLPRLTTKGLFIWDAESKTTAGFDPFIIDPDTNYHLANAAVKGGNDPSLKTGALGANYTLTDWASINGVWEYTNDATLASGDFPRGLLNSSSFITYKEDGKTYRRTYPYLYSQGYFDQAPYDYYNIFKTGLSLTPTSKWHIYLDYTRNPNKFAGNIDDNMNHYGIETSYVPTDRIGFFARYIYSQWNDINRLVYDNVIDYKNFSNVFLEVRYIPARDASLSLQYGVGPAYGIQTSFNNPLLSYYTSSVLETQHIVRLICEKKF